MKLVITGLLVGVAALSACSAQPEQPAPQVASVQTSESTAPTSQGQPSSTAKPPQDRPRFRIDMTSEEQAALYIPYRKCMVDHGMPEDLGRGRTDGQAGPVLPGAGQAGGRGSGQMPPKEVQEAAAKACDGLLPLPAWENDVNNPEAFDFARRVVACLRAKGVKYVEVSKGEDTGIVGPAFGGPQNDPESISKGLDLTPKCEREVAAGGYK
ncbi:hypothetical protein LWC34_28815 [Kibdelosporangium philippinense]|uniref:Lipoprotein n=1 Tax=Kibdelosporangium philippinense TaxID=211113 RepID=A0ABS8ZG44_9PSEU|nr:hypothetical protein [Kibdelosporangium philippinense]MCE7006799.1 hypothetical protein [Kibdelosporangium philippinense]